LHLRAFKKGEAADAGALCELVDEDDHRAVYFLAPGRGMALGTGTQKVQVITPLSPIGRELLGKREGDDLEVELRGAVRSYTVRSIR
jgi:transcription elongation GreA/GreB family factor